MKVIFLFTAFLLSVCSYAQIPNGYYNTATGTGYVLKTQLYNKIKGHTSLSYDALWITYSTSDRDNQYENDNTIIDMYSENPSGADPVTFTYNTDQCGNYDSEGDCYNREHIIPQSVFNSASPMVSDAHFVPPTDGYVNGMRSDYPHGNVATASSTSFNGSKLGTSAVAGYVGTVFEPINEFKGDIARMYFYFATRYENTVANYSFEMFDGTSNKVFTTAFLNMLLTWHNQDPVSAREIARNNAIYARQNNRNPFIDHPEYVAMIWAPTADTQAPTVPTNLVASNIATTSLTLTWTASTDNITVTAYDVYMNGVFKTTVTSATASITGLTSNTNYSFYVIAKDAAGNVSANSTTINATTLLIVDTIPPTMPTSITTSAIASTTLTINWSNSSDNVGVTEYEVYVNGILTTTVTSTSATLTGLTASTSYAIYIKAKDAAGNSSAVSTTINLSTCYC
ncbi:MAG: endonuclease [Bacteroidota bacterium]